MAKFSKRAAASPPGSAKQPFSKKLQATNDLVAKREETPALEKLDELATSSSGSWETGKILSMVADTQLNLGRFEEAANIYAASKQSFTQAENPEWFRAALGEIRALLKALKPLRAYEKALETVERAMADERKFSALRQTGIDEVAARGEILIGPRPLRPTVILTRLGHAFLMEGDPVTGTAPSKSARLGHAFLMEGDPGIAGEFFREALRLAPNGASRARQGLARIALAQGQPEEAERFARESLQTGRFQAKTLAAWPLLIEARKRRELPLLDGELYAALLFQAAKPILARSTLLIVNSLRGHRDGSWKNIAGKWLEENAGVDPVIDVEISKVLLAEAKLTGTNPEAMAQSARLLLSRSELLSPSEAVGAAKTIALYALRAGDTGKELETVAADIERGFGEETRAKAVHAMALGAMMAARHEVARGLLRDQLSRIEKGSAQWGRGWWALARMESVLGNHAISAGHYLTVAGHPLTPARFRIQGFLAWVDQVRRSGNPPEVAEVKRKLDPILASTGDFRLLLDAGRQLALSGVEFRDLTDIVSSKAVRQATLAFENAREPREALEILILLARRQFYDFGETGAMISFWEKLPTAKREWLWASGSHYWEYLSLIFQVYEGRGNPEEADRLAETMLAESGVPPVGVIHLASTYGDSLIRRERFAGGMKQLRRVTGISPTHELAAHAYYWQALFAHKRSRPAATVEHATALRRCFATKPALHWQWALDARALLLLADAGSPRTTAEPERYGADFLAIQRDAIAADLLLVP